MAGNIAGSLTFLLQRKTGTGAWSTIATSDTLSVNLGDTAQTLTDSGTISVTVDAATLNWTTSAQYRILVRKTLSDSSTLTNISAASGRTYSVSMA